MLSIKTMFSSAKSDAMDYVFGYMNVNDVTSRLRNDTQWLIGKGLIPSSMGPWLLTSNDVPDVGALKLETIVNGEIRQSAKVSDLILTFLH